ncbi:Uncharacterised protein [Lacrimispora sphenoides]|nr:Uncharacterised protein [Lacrimispora sphenoides]
MKACRTGIEFHENESVPVPLYTFRTPAENQNSLDISFFTPYN